MIALKKIKINSITLNNRICVAPMCQYSSANGSPSKWHYKHLGMLMKLQAGLMMIESTSVSKIGRISLKDLTLTNKKNFNDFKKLIKYLKLLSKTKIGIQLSHSGRKGSSEIPWIKSNCSIKNKKKSWKTIAPSAIKRANNWPTPKEMTIMDIKKVINEFGDATTKLKKIKIDCLEIHMAHGYLLHQFFSPVSNIRKDEYGGNLQNRCRFLLEVAKKVRELWPKEKILGARVNGQDWLKNGSKLKDCIYLTKELKKIGFDYVCVSSGGILPKTNVVHKTGYQVKFAKKIKKEAKMITKTTGMIKDLRHANKIIVDKNADLVAFGRKFINSPYWLIKEMKKLKKTIQIENQYKRCF